MTTGGADAAGARFLDSPLEKGGWGGLSARVALGFELGWKDD